MYQLLCAFLGSDDAPVCSVAQLCPKLFDPMNCSPPSSSVRENFQARILEWGAFSYSRGLNQDKGKKAEMRWKEDLSLKCPLPHLNIESHENTYLKINA